MTNLIGKQIDLSKNFWSKRQGLRSLLNAASNVPDSFKYLNIANLSYRVDWQASKTPEQLEIADIKLGGEITLNNLKPKMSLDLSNIPGTIDYQVNTNDNLTTLAITGGFAPSRVKSFEIAEYGGNKANEIIIKDNGRVRDLLANTEISVDVRITQKNPHPELNPDRGDYIYKDYLEFEAPPNKPATGSMTVNDNLYTLSIPLSNRALNDFWFASGADITYTITVVQTTKKGTKYRQDMNVEFVVP